MNKDEEFDLVTRCQQGDRRALEGLVRQYQRPVYNAAFRLLGNAEDAADVTQTTFLKAFESIGRFDRNYRFFSWIFRIGLNEAIDQLKRSKRFEPMLEAPASDANRTPDSVARAQNSVHIQAALMELKSEYREVLVLRYFTECSYGEIADVLRIPGKTVKSRLFTARQQLKAQLEQRGLISI